MSGTSPSRQTDPPGTGTDRRGATGVRADVAALAATVLWLLIVAAVVWLSGGRSSEGQALRVLTAMGAVVLPIAAIWFAAFSLGSARTMRRETARLHDIAQALRRDYAAQQKHLAGALAGSPSVAVKIDALAESQGRIERALLRLADERGETGRVAPPPHGDPEPPAARGDRAPTGAPLDLDEMIAALRFPADASDEAGFAALRRALRDRHSAPLVTAAQDVLTLLSQDRIYMDDLEPEAAAPEFWRRFSRGARGAALKAPGGVHEEALLDRIEARMKGDPIFRDAAHHFLRAFEALLREVEPKADDARIMELADTRTARAFMLVGRAAGLFG